MLLVDEVAAVLARAETRCPRDASADERFHFLSLSLAEHFAGQQIYWAMRDVRQAFEQARNKNGKFAFSPIEPTQSQTERDAEIIRDFHAGVDANTLARRHGLSVQTIYWLIRQHTPAPDQRDLFAPDE